MATILEIMRFLKSMNASREKYSKLYTREQNQNNSKFKGCNL